jgi:predicted metallo-beta-lactamase superfamily hydrolase
MRIEILGAESLGVRGLCCAVEAAGRSVVIDPGLALGYDRHGLLPHPAQVAVGEAVRRKILAALEEASDVVVSHLHGDHIPMPDANPYQLKAQQAADVCRASRFWVKGRRGLSQNMVHRRQALSDVLRRDLPAADGEAQGPLTFSPPVAHGEPGTHLGTVMMTRIEDEGIVFVHASDIQLLDAEAVSMILEWAPDVALIGGPPLYLSRFMGPRRRRRAWRYAEWLARHVDTLIFDHHLLRCEAGLRWLDRLSSETSGQVMCAADFMGRPRCLLEAQREALYEEMPVPPGWHEAYAQGEADTSGYRRYVDRCTEGRSGREGG